MTSLFAKSQQLAQVTPSVSLTFEDLVVGAGQDGPRIEVTQIVVCNTSGVAVAFRLTHDVDGSTSTVGTALYWDKTVPLQDSFVWQAQHPSGGIMVGKNGSLRFAASSPGVVTCTVYGVVEASQDQIRYEA